MILVVVFGYVAYALAAPRRDNPFASANFISYPLPPRLGDAAAHYDYGRRDVAFLLFYLLVFSFTRQATVEYVLRPLAKYAGLRREAKILRFCEQGYTFLYFSISGSYGIVRRHRCPVAVPLIRFTAGYVEAADVVVPHRALLARLPASHDGLDEVLLPPSIRILASADGACAVYICRAS
jgi:hypothetical protein